MARWKVRVLYVLWQVAVLIGVSAGLRLTLFPDRQPVDWAITIGLGSLVITPFALSLYRKHYKATAAVSLIALVWLIGRFAGDYFPPAYLVYLSLAGCCLFLNQYTAAIFSGVMVIALIIGVDLYGPIITTQEHYGYIVLLNLIFFALATASGIKEVGHGATKTQNSYYIPESKKAA